MVKQYLGLRGRSLQFAISFVCTTGFLLFGYVCPLPSQMRVLTYMSTTDTTKVRCVQTQWQKQYDTDRAGVMSGIITAPEFNREIPETKDNSTMQGFVTAIYEIGCLIGAVFVLIVGERLGRRRSIMTGAFIMIAGVMIQVTAYSGHQSLVWREAHTLPVLALANLLDFFLVRRLNSSLAGS